MTWPSRLCPQHTYSLFLSTQAAAKATAATAVQPQHNPSVSASPCTHADEGRSGENPHLRDFLLLASVACRYSASFGTPMRSIATISSLSTSSCTCPYAHPYSCKAHLPHALRYAHIPNKMRLQQAKHCQTNDCMCMQLKASQGAEPLQVCADRTAFNIHTLLSHATTSHRERAGTPSPGWVQGKWTL